MAGTGALHTLRARARSALQVLHVAAPRSWQGRLSPTSKDTRETQRLCHPFKPSPRHPSCFRLHA